MNHGSCTTTVSEREAYVIHQLYTQSCDCVHANMLPSSTPAHRMKCAIGPVAAGQLTAGGHPARACRTSSTASLTAYMPCAPQTKRRRVWKGFELDRGCLVRNSPIPCARYARDLRATRAGAYMRMGAVTHGLAQTGLKGFELDQRCLVRYSPEPRLHIRKGAQPHTRARACAWVQLHTGLDLQR